MKYLMASLIVDVLISSLRQFIFTWLMPSDLIFSNVYSLSALVAINLVT